MRPRSRRAPCRAAGAPKMRNQLRVAVGAELMSLRFELRFRFGIVEKLAVEDDDDGLVLPPRVARIGAKLIF